MVCIYAKNNNLKKDFVFLKVLYVYFSTNLTNSMNLQSLFLKAFKMICLSLKEVGNVEAQTLP